MWPSLAQTSSSTLDLAQWISEAGPTALLGLVVVALLKGWLVTGKEHERVKRELDRALDLVYKNADITERAVDVSIRRLEAEEQLLELRRGKDKHGSP